MGNTLSYPPLPYNCQMIDVSKYPLMQVSGRCRKKSCNNSMTMYPEIVRINVCSTTIPKKIQPRQFCEPLLQLEKKTQRVFHDGPIGI